VGRRRSCAITAAVAVVAFLIVVAPAGAKPARFRVGAATVGFTPPRAGKLADDPSDCATGAQRAQYSGVRRFAFEEPYTDQQGSGHYDLGDPYLDCNGNGRWDGNYLGGGADSPRFYDHVADPVGARAMVVGNGSRRIAVEVLDNEGAFNVYLHRIRARVAADGYHLAGIFISSTHDESAPDTIGISGPTDPTTSIPASSVNAYFADYMVRRAALAIERADRRLRAARIDYGEAREPANLRQCWSSYPFVDDQLMPTLRAVDDRGRTIVTLADVSQHAESLGFNPNQKQRRWISADWVHFFRQRLEQRFGGVAIEMAGSVGSVETPQVFDRDVSQVPQRFVDADHPAGCRTLFDQPAGATAMPLGYHRETRALGEDLADSVGRALARHGHASRSNAVWGARASICIPLDNAQFLLGAAIGIFAERTGYSDDCRTATPPAPDGSTSGNELKSDVAAFRIGAGEFASVPGEVFPFTYLRGPLGPGDMPHPGPSLPGWLLPHMHAPYRFIDGLAEDMTGYVFPRGNAVGVPSTSDLDPDDTDRFGCGHSDDAESASPRTAGIAGKALVRLLDRHDGVPERVTRGRYVLPHGTRSRDPLGEPFIKCDVDRRFHFGGRAVAVWRPGKGRSRPAAWMSLSGRRQEKANRDTRGYYTDGGKRVWLNTFAPLAGAP
jgi:hypothetical protein